MAFLTMILVLLALAGGASRPTSVPGQVVYSMSATLDGKPLPTLVGITASSCDDGYGGFTLTFTATADMAPQAIDDEIELSLEIRIGDISKIALGEPVNVANNRNIRLLASPTAFIDPAALKPLNTASGTLTISALQKREIRGSASLTFTDPDDVNAVVNDSLTYEVTFSSLAVIHYCPEN